MPSTVSVTVSVAWVTVSVTGATAAPVWRSASATGALGGAAGAPEADGAEASAGATGCGGVGWLGCEGAGAVARAGAPIRAVARRGAGSVAASRCRARRVDGRPARCSRGAAESCCATTSVSGATRTEATPGQPRTPTRVLSTSSATAPAAVIEPLAPRLAKRPRVTRMTPVVGRARQISTALRRQIARVGRPVAVLAKPGRVLVGEDEDAPPAIGVVARHARAQQVVAEDQARGLVDAVAVLGRRVLTDIGTGAAHAVGERRVLARERGVVRGAEQRHDQGARDEQSR